MPVKGAVKAVLLDLGVAALAAALFGLGGALTGLFGDLRGIFITAVFLFVAAGFLRGSSPPAKAWLKAVVLISVCILLMVVGSGAPPVLLVLLALVCGAGSLAGVYARRSWSVHRSSSVLTTGTTLAVVVAGSLLGAPALATRLTTRQANTPAAAFSVTRLDGNVVNSADFRGRVVVLDFWATWCPPCRRELPKLETLYKHYQSNPNVVFLAIDVQRNDETPEKARAFIRKAGYTIPAAFDDRNAVDQLHAEGYPHLLLLDKAGHIRLDHQGYDGAEDLVGNLSKEIDRLLAERTPPG
jgi:thiol-disulfide isomerase/thioredoxin